MLNERAVQPRGTSIGFVDAEYSPVDDEAGVADNATRKNTLVCCAGETHDVSF